MNRNKLLIAALLLGGAQCQADQITVTFDQPVLSGWPGATLIFTGTIANNTTSVIDLNGISATLPGMFSLDRSLFTDPANPATVDPGLTTPSFPFFSVTIADPYTDPLFVTATGSLVVLGGLEGPAGYDPTVQNNLGGADFGVTPAPEPASPLLLASAAAFLWLAARFVRARRVRAE